ncbi:MAG TPA: DNA cytosine methyltransferase [Prosthecobacter sp.]|nr:DNA cytosine methyltransferase [Prosthecobacter sp.]
MRRPLGRSPPPQNHPRRKRPRIPRLGAHRRQRPAPPLQKGELFRAWVKALEASGYRVEWRVLCAADYGDPTTRRRLFVQAVRGRRKITWPDPTHSPAEERDLISSRKPWVPARDIIDWSDPGKSIFTRKKPLAEKTMRRILAGLEKFGTAQPFILPQQAGGRPAHSVNEPISTIATAGAHALCQPYLIDVNHSGHDHRVYPICSPMKTVTGSRGVGLCNPYLIKFYGTGDAQPITDPLSTVTTKDRFGLCQPIVEFEGSRYTLDILFRMLKPAELAAAQGFPRGYQFAGNISEVTKQIGNAVPVGLAKALAKTAIQNL